MRSKSVILASSLLMASVSIIATEHAVAQTAQAQTYTFDIPAQPLAAALDAFSDQTRISVLASADQLAGYTSLAVTGQYTASDALAAMLANSNLAVSENGPRSFALVAKRLDKTRLPETIVVTATKTQTNIQEVPAAVSVVPLEKILAQGAQTAVEALQGEPGVRVSYYTEGNFPIVQIRSSGDAGQFQNTDILVLIDGIPQVNLNDQSYYDQIAFEAVDRIEVVRGPTSALYGRNAVGGTLNIITRGAPEEFEAQATLSAGSFGFIKPRLTVGGALNDRARILVSGSYEHSNGWRDRIERDAIDIFARADFDLAPSTDLMMTLQFFDLTQGVPTILPLLADATEVPGVAREDNFNLLDAESQNQSLQIAAVLTHRFSDALTLTAPFYYRDTDRTLQNDGSFIDNIDTVNQTLDLFPFEPSSSDGIFGLTPRVVWTPSQALELIGGVDFEINNANGGAANIFPAGTNFFTPIRVNYITGEFETDINSVERLVRRDGDFRSTVWAIYGQARYDITDALRITVGGRYDRQNRRLEDDLRPNPLVEADYGRFTPRVALDYAFTEDLHGYVSYSQGFNPPFGGAFAFEREGADELTPEVANNYEIGLKATLPDGRGFANLAAFFLDRNDLVQTLRIGGENRQTNAGGLDVWGIEIDAGIDLGGGFTATGNYSFTKTEWQEFTVRGTSFAGFEVIQNPKHLANLSLNWTSPDDHFSFGAFVDYVGKRFADRANTVTLPSYTLVNLQAAVQPFKDDRITLRVQGFNLLDERYLSRTELDFGGNVLGGSPGRPASWLASVTVRY